MPMDSKSLMYFERTVAMVLFIQVRSDPTAAVGSLSQPVVGRLSSFCRVHG